MSVRKAKRRFSRLIRIYLKWELLAGTYDSGLGIESYHSDSRALSKAYNKWANAWEYQAGRRIRGRKGYVDGKRYPKMSPV